MSSLILPGTAVKLCISCMVCGEGVELTKEEEAAINYGRPVPPKICTKCKEAIFAMRKQLEEEAK